MRLTALTALGLSLILASCQTHELEVEPSSSDLQFTDLATVWDEAMPLGNATLGSLIWQRDGKLRFSLDRSDLWDLRPLDCFQSEFFSFQYDFFIEDSLGHFNDWDSCVWHRSKNSWQIEPFTMEEWPDRSYCRIYVAEHDDTPVELSCTVYNSHCEPYSIKKKFYLKSSFFDIDEQNEIHPDFSVMPNPNDGQMTLVFSGFEGKVDIKVYDATGNLIDSFATYIDMDSKALEYDLRARKGIYFLVANGKGGTIAKKVIIR